MTSKPGLVVEARSCAEAPGGAGSGAWREGLVISPRFPVLSRAIPAVVLSCAAMFAACGSESVPRRDAASNDGAISDTPLPSDAAGELRIGGGTLPPPSDAELPPFTTDAPYVVVNDSCCTVVLSIADPTADETTALLEGDVAPLAATRGVPLAWADDRWSATVCLPKETLVSYRFYFGQKPRVWDVPGQDGGAGAEDGGAGEAEDAEVELVDDYRTSDEEPTTLDSSAQSWNVFAPVLTCPSPP